MHRPIFGYQSGQISCASLYIHLRLFTCRWDGEYQVLGGIPTQMSYRQNYMIEIICVFPYIAWEMKMC